MTIQHHPSNDLVAAYAGGSLDSGRHIIVATHLLHCESCRHYVRALEHLGGALLEALAPADMAEDAFARIEARLDEPAPSEAPLASLSDIPGIPDFVRRIPAGKWRWVAPGLQVRPIVLPRGEPMRVFLLKSQPGARLLEHTHTGDEMTCVLTGSFSHDGARYAPGDFDFGDPGIAHAIEVGAEEVCVSLVAMQGKLKLNGLLGKIVQPFISL